MKQHRAGNNASADFATVAGANTAADFLQTTVPGDVTTTTDTPLLDAVTTETGTVRGAIEAALTAIANGQPIPGGSVTTLVAELTKAREKGSLGTLRAKVSVGVTKRPESEAGASTLARCREEAAARAPEGETPGPLDDAYHQGFADLYEAVCAEGGLTDQTTWALVVAGADSSLFDCAGGRVGLDDFPTFAWVGAHKVAGDVAKASKRFGDPLWCAFLHGIHGEELLKGSVYATLPTHLRPEALDILLENPKLLALLGATPAVLDIAIADLIPTDPNFVTLATSVASRDAGKLSVDGFAVWAKAASKSAVSGFKKTAQDNLITALGTRFVDQSVGLKTWLSDEMQKETGLGRSELLYKARFGLAIKGMRKGQEAGAATDVSVLRKLWTVLDKLPQSHVSENDALDAFRRHEERDFVAGGHSKSTGDIYLSYPESGATKQQLGHVPNMGVERSMRPVNALSHVVRHEVGHAVDEDNAVMSSNRGQKKFGGWDVFADDAEAAKALTTDPKAPTSLKSKELAEALSSGDASKVAALGDGNDLVATGAAKAMENPGQAWVGDPKAIIGDHVYVRFSGGSWQRYDKDARDKGVSDYQFKTPGEWFAEAYAAHYDGKLSGINGEMAQWLSANEQKLSSKKDK